MAVLFQFYLWDQSHFAIVWNTRETGDIQSVDYTDNRTTSCLGITDQVPLNFGTIVFYNLALRPCAKNFITCIIVWTIWAFILQILL